jgi:hypothetical protein
MWPGCCTVCVLGSIQAEVESFQAASGDTCANCKLYLCQHLNLADSVLLQADDGQGHGRGEGDSPSTVYYSTVKANVIVSQQVNCCLVLCFAAG